MASVTVRSTDKALKTRRAGETMLVQHQRPRNLIGQMTAALLQPGTFFSGLTESRQWLWVALLVLALTGAVAVRQAALVSEAANPAAPGEMPGGDMGMGGPAGGGVSMAPGAGPMDPGIPVDAGVSGPTTSPAEVDSAWTTALVAAGTIALGWVIQMILLCEVSLFRGRAPSLGQNLRIAVWASLPLALMTGLQLAYYAAGGTVGQAGLIGYASEVPGFTEQAPFVQALIISALSHATVFWLWSALLLYFGARYALGGHWFTSILVVFMWVAVLVIAPVATGAITAPETVVQIDQTQSPTTDWSGLKPGSGGEPVPGSSSSSEGDEAQPASPQRSPMKG